jgi:TRAP-type C4-dicarboxylate transport system substrate-binding protein
MMSVAKIGAAAALAATVTAAGLAEAKTVKITAIGAPPPIVTNVKVVKEYMIPEINKRLEESGRDFRIEWREAWAQTLAKFDETFEAVEEGIAHLGVIITSFEESKLPLEQYSNMVPFGGVAGAQLDAIDKRVRTKVPEINGTYARYNQVFLESTASDTFGIATKFPITSVDDLKNHKIGTTGTNGHWLRGTGAVIVTSSMADAYTNIRSGVYEGYIVAVSLAFPYRIDEAAPNFTRVNFGGSVATTLTMNKALWAELPDFVQKIFIDTAKGWSQRYIETTEQQAKAFAPLMEKRGTKFLDMTPAERAKWAKMLPNVPKQWAEGLDKKGEPGTKLLRAYMDELRASGIQVVRDWDKE